MFKTKKIILILLLFIIFCDKDKNENLFKKFDTKNLESSVWRIVPSNNIRISFEKEQRSFLLEGENRKEIFIFEDARGIRIQYDPYDTKPIGYFLFSEKKESIWSGVFEDTIVRMEKNKTNPESILE
jgi:hypothetical protein